MRNTLFSLMLVLICGMSFAETCPSIKALKKTALAGWTFYNSTDDKPLSTEREAFIKKQAKQLAVVEWTSQDGKTGSVHCYYMDKDGSHFDAYLAKENLTLSSARRYWYPVTGSMNCAAGISRCQFSRAINHGAIVAKT